MITIYGIKNCDTMQKAFKWLAAKGIAYKFHDYREDGIDEPTIRLWLQHLPLAQVVNARSTTYRELPEREKAFASRADTAIALIIAHPSIVKRPLWHLGSDDFILGWNEDKMNDRLVHAK